MPNQDELTLEILSERIAEFCRDRDWEQYHTPKNLSMALSVEASELMEIFQWLTAEQSSKGSLSPGQLKAAEEEIADVLIYAIRISQVLGIDLLKAIREKIEKNNAKYPADKVRGKASLD